MMEKKREAGITLGGISILAVFVVLCLTTLAALSLVSARADLAMSQKGASASLAYYKADLEAEKKLKGISESINNANWSQSLKDMGCDTRSVSSNALEVSFLVEIDAARALYVAVEIQLDAQGMPTGEWMRKSHRTIVTPAQDEGGGMNILHRE
jgi:hypothetical protein